jgi:hypothetical protein
MAAANQKPYVGLRPFGRDEEDLFFGRDRETRDLCSLVVAHPIVLLYAASGAGKSSLLNAGLIPLLEQRGYDVLPPARVSGRIPDAIKTSEVNNVFVQRLVELGRPERRPQGPGEGGHRRLPRQPPASKGRGR